MSIKVESGVPLPRHHGNRKYPFGDLEVGQSFLAPTSSPSSLAAQASVYGKKHGITLTVRKTAEGPRVWRVA